MSPSLNTLVTSLVYAGLCHQLSDRLLEFIKTTSGLVYPVENFTGRRLELVLQLLQQLLHVLGEVSGSLGVDGCGRDRAVIGGR